MRAVIIGSGAICDYGRISNEINEAPNGGAFIICCDGGARHAKILGLTPDLIVGDFDSIDAETLRFYENMGIPVDKYPAAKDCTDTEIALEKAVSKGADEIVFIGVTGDRADHTLANIGLLYTCLKRGIAAVIIDDNNKITLIDKKTELREKPGQTVSLLPFTKEVCGITTRGLAYPLKNESLIRGTARGVSNVCESGSAEIDLKSGALLLIIPARV